MKRIAGNIARGLPERVGWKENLAPFLFKKLPSKTGWAVTLGSVSVLLFVTMFVSGVFLAMYYNPSPDKAYEAIDYIMKEVPAGKILRGIHHWGASAMVIAVFLHMMSSFFHGSYRKPREVTWISGVVMLLIVLGLGFTGYLLQWDLKAYWATTVSTNIPKDIPIIGNFVSRMMLGGDSISGATLTRFYAVHAMLLPALLVALIAFHIYLVRAHGIAVDEEVLSPSLVTPGEGQGGGNTRTTNSTPSPALPRGTEGGSEGHEKPYRFYPEHLWRSTIVFIIVFLILLVLSAFAHVPREDKVGTLRPDYLPRPEWYYMWLFQLLTYFPGKWEAVGSLAIPFLGVTILFAMPFLGKSRKLGVRNRPLPLALGVMAIVGIAYLTAMGFAGAKPYGETVLVPERNLTPSESRGLALYVDRQCSYCHQINGTGGHRVGPDFSNTAAKHRTQDYLARYIKDPQSINSTSIMPKYDLPQSDLNALADFLLAVGAGGPMKTVSREQALSASVK